MRSSASFLMLVFMMGIALVVFSTLMFLAEQGKWDEEKGCYSRMSFNTGLEEDCSPFGSIPATFW